MNAIELFGSQEESLNLWMCSKCRRLGATPRMVEACCQPRECQCGAQCDFPWTACGSCREANDMKRIANLVSMARKVPEGEWDAPVVPDGCDTGFVNVDCMREHYENEGEDVPTPVWGTRPNPLRLNADDIVAQACEEMHEGAFDDATGLDVLQAFMDNWLREHGFPNAWTEDRSIVIVLDTGYKP